MLLDLVRKRQSTRKYSPRPVKKDKILKCLEAARLAPSACNSQPWHFIIVDRPALKKELCEEIFSGPYAMNAFAKEAPVIVAVISGSSSVMAQIGGLLRRTPYHLLDVALAVEHFILAATEEGLGTCWIGWFNEKQLKKILKIPARKKVDCIISVGYPDDPLREKKRKELKEIVSFNDREKDCNLF